MRLGWLHVHVRVMALAKVLCLLVVLLTPRLTCANSGSGVGETVLDVCSDNATMESVLSGCVDINEALLMVTSNTVLYLSGGKHTVSTFIVHSSMDGISFIGREMSSEVIVTCMEGVGLAFFNSTNLSFQNVTIEGCGLSGSEHWDTIVRTTNEIVDEVVKIPTDVTVSVAIFMAICENVTMDMVNVVNTTGIGLLAVNVVGSITLDSMTFERNRPRECHLSLSTTDQFQESEFIEWIGGAAYFLYEDYDSISTYSPPSTGLTVTESNFLNNQDCGVVGTTEHYIHVSPAVQELGYYIGASGGLSVMMAQKRYPVNVIVQSTVFHNNSAKYGGGAHIGIFEGSIDNHVTFLDCVFHQNGNSSIFFGGALAVLIDLWRPPSSIASDSLTEQQNSVLQVLNTNFSGNVAYGGGGVFLASLYAQGDSSSGDPVRALFEGCIFDSNAATGGAAIIAYENKENSIHIGMQVELRDIIVCNNLALSAVPYGPPQTPGSVAAQAINLTVSGNSHFHNNSASALVGLRSQFNFKGHITFSNNTAVYGGALCLYDRTFLVVHRDTSVSFVNNEAALMGGAMFVMFFVDGLRFFEYSDCFLFFEEISLVYCSPTSCPNPLKLNISISFINNTAPTAGAIYGSTLENCSWTTNLPPEYRNKYGSQLYQYLNNETTLMTFNPPPVGVPQVSSIPKYIQVDETVVEVMPGQKFEVKAHATDWFKQPIAEVISSGFEGRGGAQLGDSGSWIVNPSSPETSVTVRGDQNQNISVQFYSSTSAASDGFTVKLTTCLAGFVYETSNRSCVCEPALLDKGVVCDVNRQEHWVPDNVWYGPIDSGRINYYTPENVNDGLVVRRCVLGYCINGRKSVPAGNYSSQCVDDYHRDGFLCGHCQSGYSIQFGSYRCQKCTNYSLFMLVVFALAGVLLVLAMKYLHLTVSEGYMYSVLLYSNVVDTFIVLFSPTLPASGVFVLGSVLSLSVGFEVCFYDGMDALALNGMRLLFIGYLVAIIGAIYVIARCKSQTKRFAKSDYSPVKILANLMVLCYIALLQFCIGILAGVRVETLGGKVEYRWYKDPTVHYFSIAHGALVMVSIILIVAYIIPLPLLALFPTKVYKWKYTRKFKPFFDALWAPFKVEYRFWLGLRLMLRWMISGFGYFIPPPHNLLALGLLLLLLLFVQSKIQPFRGLWHNLIDDCLITNLIILTTGTLYFHADDNDGSTGQLIFSAVLAFWAYLVFFGVFTHHLFLRFPRMKDYLAHLLAEVRGFFSKKQQLDVHTEQLPTELQNANNLTDQRQVRTADSFSEGIEMRQAEHIDAGHDQRIIVNSATPPRQLGPPHNRPLEAPPKPVSFIEPREPLLEDDGEPPIPTKCKIVRLLSPSAPTLGDWVYTHTHTSRDMLVPPSVE